MKNKKFYNLFSIIFTLFILLIGLIVLDAFKNDFYIFIGSLGVLSVIIGIISIIFDFIDTYKSCRIKILSLVLLMIFSSIYSVINPELKVLFLIFFIFSLALLILFIFYIHRNIANLDTPKPITVGRYIKISIWLKLAIVINIIIIAMAWIYPFERYFNIFEGPNGEGLTSYISEDDSPACSVNVDGGYIYNVADTASANSGYQSGISEITGVFDIHLLEPEANIDIFTFAKGKLLINLINYSEEYNTLTVNGETYNLILHENNFTAKCKENSDESILSDLINSSYLNSYKGHYFVLNVEAGTEYNINVQNISETSGDWSFYSTSDMHAGINVVIPVFRKILYEEPDFIFLNGDIVNNGSKSEYMIMGELFNSYNIPVYPVIGNHDAWGVGEKYYASFFGPYFYSFEYKNATFIIFDTSSGIIGKSQFDWLENELQKASTELIFLVSHISPVDTKIGIFDSDLNLSPQSNHSIQSKAESDKILALCEQYNVDCFLAGHSHEYGRSDITDTIYITSGVLGGTAGDDDDIGYLKIDVSGNDFTIDFIDTSEYYRSGMLKTLQAVQVFLIPAIRGKAIGLILTLLLLCVDYCLWIIFKNKLIFIVLDKAKY